jgi:hypothetical protein
VYSHFASEEEIVTAIAGEVPQGITSSLGAGLRRRAGSVPDECAQSPGERGGVDAGAECELVEEGGAEGGQDQRGVFGGGGGIGGAVFLADADELGEVVGQVAVEGR